MPQILGKLPEQRREGREEQAGRCYKCLYYSSFTLIVAVLTSYTT